MAQKIKLTSKAKDKQKSDKLSKTAAALLSADTDIESWASKASDSELREAVGVLALSVQDLTAQVNALLKMIAGR